MPILSNVCASSFVWSLVNRLPKPWNASWGFQRTFFNPDSSFLMAFMFQGQSSVRWKCWIHLTTHPWRPLPNNPWARRHRWVQLWSLPGDLNRKFEHAFHCREVCSVTAARKLVSWALYSPDLALGDFALFPKLKIELKGRCLDTVWHPKGITSTTQHH
jgi:hypothetical protein